MASKLSLRQRQHPPFTYLEQLRAVQGRYRCPVEPIGGAVLTYIPTEEGWLYLTTVMDLADRKIIGWTQSESMEAELTTIPALRMALTNRTPENGMVFHSDRGVQYA